MAQNMVHNDATNLSVVCSHPATPKSGDPVLHGQRPGVALTDEGGGGNSATKTTVKFTGGFKLPVKAIDGGGNSAVAEGDIIYYTAGDTPPLSKKATGVRFGYAGPDMSVTAGATASIEVILGY